MVNTSPNAHGFYDNQPNPLVELVTNFRVSDPAQVTPSRVNVICDQVPVDDTRSNNTATDTPHTYNEDWSPEDMIELIRHGIDATEIVCHWVVHGRTCDDRVKIKDLKAHLENQHDIVSSSETYPCLWLQCKERNEMRKYSLERHLREQHTGLKWPCPTCDAIFSRESSMLEHRRGRCGRCRGQK